MNAPGDAGTRPPPAPPALRLRRRGGVLLIALAGALLTGCGSRAAGAGGVAAAEPAADHTNLPHGAASIAPDSLRVLVYNIHAGKDAAGAPNPDRVAALIRDTGADLVLLQEVDRGTRRSGGVDQLAELARATGLHGAFGRTLDYQGGAYGIAVLSRWPILSDTLIPLPVDPPQERAGGAYEPRGALRVTVAAPGGAIGIVNTHLDAGRAEHYRLQEVATVAGVAAGLGAGETPVIVGGDFNAEPGSATIRRMLDAGWRDAWAECGTGPGGTYPAEAPIKRIDYLFFAGGVGCRVARALETTTSDHRPLLITLTRGP